MIFFSEEMFICAGHSEDVVYNFFLLSFCLFRAAPVTYGGSQERGRIGAVATGLGQGHSNEGSGPRLRPATQLTATPDP